MTFDFVLEQPGGYSFQWFLEDAAIEAATNAVLVISPVAAADAGSYRVVVANASGATRSDAAWLLLNPPADPRLPGLVCPGNVVITGAGAMPVRFVLQVTKGSATNLSVFSQPASGTVFPTGTTIVTNRVVVNGLTNTCFFTVTVCPPDPEPSNAPAGLTVRAIQQTTNGALALRPVLFPALVFATNVLNWTLDSGGEFEGTALVTLPDLRMNPQAGFLFVKSLRPDPRSGLATAEPTEDGWRLHFYNSDLGPARPWVTDPPRVWSPTSYRSEATYVPLDTPHLAAGEVFGETGQLIRQAGEFEFARVGVGRYELKVGDKSAEMGSLLLNPLPDWPDLSNTSSRILLSSTYSNGVFEIVSREAITGVNGFDSVTALRDVNFAFGFLDFATPASSAQFPCGTPPVISMGRLSGGFSLSWFGSIGSSAQKKFRTRSGDLSRRCQFCWMARPPWSCQFRPRRVREGSTRWDLAKKMIAPTEGSKPADSWDGAAGSVMSRIRLEPRPLLPDVTPSCPSQEVGPTTRWWAARRCPWFGAGRTLSG